MKELNTREEFDAFVAQEWKEYAPDAMTIVEPWFQRGDGCAVYRNEAMDSMGLGDLQMVSFGSPAAQIEADTPPIQMPDIGSSINWKFRLYAAFRPSS